MQARRVILAVSFVGLFVGHTRSIQTAQPAPATTNPGAPTSVFEDVAERVGLSFWHFNGGTGRYHLPEIAGSGVAVLDYDGDGDLDVFFVQAGLLDTPTLANAVVPVPPGWKLGSRLFRNELIPTGKLQFTEVTERAGVGSLGYGMGAAVGDYDNDGRPDLFVTGLGGTVLYHNNGNGTFTDVTKQAGVGDTGWTTSAAFCDFDLDGRLDLFVARYVDFSVKNSVRCTGIAGDHDYCGPQVFRPVPSRLFRNTGNGRFTDVTQAMGITATFGAGLGVTCADFDDDGWIDVYVANDRNANQLWMNRNGKRFEDTAPLAGAAYSAQGRAQAGMGVAAADFDHDGDEDVFVTNMVGEMNVLYRNDGKGAFNDVTLSVGLGTPSLPYTGFGTDWLDYDNDGYLDLFVANGAVAAIGSLRGTRFPYAQMNTLYRNLDGRRFADVTKASGPGLQLTDVSRGVAVADIDNDGDLDIIVSNNNGPARLLLNVATEKRHYVEILLQGVTANRSGFGASVGVLRKSGQAAWRRAHTDGSYLSARDPRVHFGLGTDPSIEAVVVRWPGGRSEIWTDVAADRLIRLREGTGRPYRAH